MVFSTSLSTPFFANKIISFLWAIKVPCNNDSAYKVSKSKKIMQTIKEQIEPKGMPEKQKLQFNSIRDIIQK